MMCMMLLLVITRLITKYVTIRALRLDDFTIVAAAVRTSFKERVEVMLSEHMEADYIDFGRYSE